MSDIAGFLMILIVIGFGFYLYKSGKLNTLIQPRQQQQAKPAAPPKVIRRHHPAATTQGTAPAPTTTGGGGGGSSATGKTIYQVVSVIPASPNVTVRSGGTSFRDNITYPCNKCARESTWIFKPGTGGDWSPKLGSHGDEGGKETLIELANISVNGTGGKWQCEGAHMNYHAVSGGTGSAPKIGGKPKVGIKAVTWPLGQNRVHHELWYDETGSGNNWKKFAEFNGAATGCNAITCPVPGSKCQDTMRLDNPSGHQFISRSMVEIRPGGGAPKQSVYAKAYYVTAPY